MKWFTVILINLLCLNNLHAFPPPQGRNDSIGTALCNFCRNHKLNPIC